MKLPINPVHPLSALKGQTNGKLDAGILVKITDPDGGPTARLVPPAAQAYVALIAAAAKDGFILKPVGVADSYRPFEVQENIFLERYTTKFIAGQPHRTFRGKRFFQKPNTAAAAVPGTSNHGWARAVDLGVGTAGSAHVAPITDKAVAWLVAHEQAFGFSHELASEPWHIRYFMGDQLPAAVLAHLTGDDDMPANSETFNAIWRGKVPGDDLVLGIAIKDTPSGHLVRTRRNTDKTVLLLTELTTQVTALRSAIGALAAARNDLDQAALIKAIDQAIDDGVEKLRTDLAETPDPPDPDAAPVAAAPVPATV